MIKWIEKVDMNGVSYFYYCWFCCWNDRSIGWSRWWNYYRSSIIVFGEFNSMVGFNYASSSCWCLSTVIMVFTGLASTLAYMKYKTVDYKAGFIFFIGSAPGGIIGAYINKFLNIDSFSLYFGLFIGDYKFDNPYFVRKCKLVICIAAYS